MWTWVVPVWEKCDKFNLVVSYNKKPIMFPRERGQWLMQMFVAAGFSKEDLIRLNMVHLQQQALFLEDVLGTSGKTLDPKGMIQRIEDEWWSTLVFPKEKPPGDDLFCGGWLSAKSS